MSPRLLRFAAIYVLLAVGLAASAESTFVGKAVAQAGTPTISPGTNVVTTDTDGGPVSAFQGSNGDLWIQTATGFQDLALGMYAGSSPAITEINGGYEIAFEANTTDLWTTGSAGTEDWGLGMYAGTSPAIATTESGGFETAIEANTTDLWTAGVDGVRDWGLGMYAGTNPSIAGLQGVGPDAYEIAFQANTTDLWVVGNSDSDTGLGMLGGTSPAITALAGLNASPGDFEVAFQANTQQLWTYGSAGSGSWNRAMDPASSPTIAATSDGGYEVAYLSDRHDVSSVGYGSGPTVGNWQVTARTGSNPDIAPGSVPGLPRVSFVSPDGASSSTSFSLGGGASSLYVALGDSYSSGEGTQYQYPTPCDQSQNAYSALLWNNVLDPPVGETDVNGDPASPELPASDYSLMACSGATTADIQGVGPAPYTNQLAALDSATALVTLTAGGNDAGFGPALEQCINVFRSDCSSLSLTDAQLQTITASLVNLYKKVLAAAPNAYFLIIGYPDIWPTAGGCADTLTLGPTDFANIHESLADLNVAIYDAYLAAGYQTGSAWRMGFLNPNSPGIAVPGVTTNYPNGSSGNSYNPWVPHSLCSDDPYANGITDITSVGPKGVFHPNVAGNQFLCQEVAQALNLNVQLDCLAPEQRLPDIACTSLPPAESPGDAFLAADTEGDELDPDACSSDTDPEEQSAPPEDDTTCEDDPEADGCQAPTPDVQSTITYDDIESTISYDMCSLTPDADGCPGLPAVADPDQDCSTATDSSDPSCGTPSSIDPSGGDGSSAGNDGGNDGGGDGGGGGGGGCDDSGDDGGDPIYCTE